MTKVWPPPEEIIAFRSPEMLAPTLVRLLESPNVPPTFNVSKSAAFTGMSGVTKVMTKSVNNPAKLFRKIEIGLFMRSALHKRHLHTVIQGFPLLSLRVSPRWSPESELSAPRRRQFIR
jgi:hypothetical protein